ncbi:tyrosine-type recombinase/integrase [Desulforhopalus singaporensis]|uniref:Site-specific recombinase XerD n=1 Tax=Desulforhopalus singaporensis TaxID=91360 RepID=A0A1H0RIC3_9BACT|nr:site-specific integrase [Desulforhopalus singaporensis]SDP29287.1 Site-specific recombinase XerD [Desulforhopalus singaporensis]
MSVHQKKDGRWFINYPKGKNTAEPNRTREYFGRGPDAEIRAIERNNELGLGKEKVDNSPPFTDLANSYLAAKSPMMSNASYIALKSKIDGVILPELGAHKGSQITPDKLDKYVSYRLKKVKRTTVHRDLCDIRAILRWSVKRRYIASNPMDGYDFPARDDAEIRPPTVAEVQAILKHSPPHLYRAIVLSYYTGLRPGEVELMRLTWTDVDLAGGNIVITSADKGGLKTRTVPVMDKNFMALLGKWLEEDLNENKPMSAPIVTYKGKPIKTIKTAWRTAKKAAKITRRMRMYDLRHSFATKLLSNGADLKHVSSLLGHKSIQQTVDKYQHLSRQLTEDALKKLPTIFEPEKDDR